MAEIVEQIHAIAEKFSASESDLSKEQESFQTLIDLVKSADAKGKVLIAGLIPQYVGSFLELGKAAVDAQLDICEDEDITVRLAAIRGLARLAENLQDKADIERVIDAALQLTVTGDDSQEAVVLNHVLSQFANTRIVSLLNCALVQIPQQLQENTRTKLFNLITTTFDPRRNKGAADAIRKETTALATDLAAFLMQAMSTLSDKEFNSLYTLYSHLAPLHGATFATLSPTHLALLTAHSGLNAPLTLASLPTAAAATHALNRLLKAKPANAHVDVLPLFRNIFAAFSLASAPEAAAPLATLSSFLVSTVAHLTPRQCNTLFPALVESVKTLLPLPPADTTDASMDEAEAIPAHAYPYQLIARVLSLLHALAAPLSDTVGDVLGLTVQSIQPSAVSATVRAQRLADIQARVGALVSTGEKEVAQREAEVKEMKKRFNVTMKLKRKAAAEERAKAKKEAQAAKAAAATTASTDAAVEPVAEPVAEAVAEGEDKKEEKEKDEEEGEVALADAAAAADVAAAVDEMVNEAEGEAEGEEEEAVAATEETAVAGADADTAATEGAAAAPAEPKEVIVPLTEEEVTDFRSKVATAAAVAAAMRTIKALAVPILTNKAVFKSAEVQATENKAAVQKSEKKESGKGKDAAKGKDAGKDKAKGGKGAAQQPQQGKAKGAQQQQQQQGKGGQKRKSEQQQPAAASGKRARNTPQQATNAPAQGRDNNRSQRSAATNTDRNQQRRPQQQQQRPSSPARSRAPPAHSRQPPVSSHRDSRAQRDSRPSSYSNAPAYRDDRDRGYSYGYGDSRGDAPRDYRGYSRDSRDSRDRRR